jgi:hypothetical protein
VVAIGVEFAKNLAIAIVALLVVAMVAAAWLAKKVLGKVVAVVLLGGLALGVWTQRSDLKKCADQVKVDPVGVTCHFFGSDIHVTPQ